MFLLHPVSQKVASLVAHSKMALCARKAVKRACCDDRCVFWFHPKQEAGSFPSLYECVLSHSMVGTGINLPSSQKSAGFDWNHSVAERRDGV